MQSFDLEDGALTRPSRRIAVSRRGLAGRLWAFAALLLTIANLTTSARAEYQGDDDVWVKKRTLCYRLSKEIADDKQWPGWIKQAIANWNEASDKYKLKWKFEECPKDQKKADIEFKFYTPTADYPKQLDNRTNHQPVGGTTSAETGPSVDAKTSTETVNITQDINQFAINGVEVSGGTAGWDVQDGSNGEKRLDPVLTIMHELTHVMLLVHGTTKCSPSDFEEPVCPGDHGPRKPSLSDINQIRYALNLSPLPTVTPKPVPACFDTAEAKQQYLEELKTQIAKLEADRKEANDRLAENPNPTSDVQKIKNIQWRFQVEQDSINISTLEAAYGEAESVDLCPGATTPAPVPGTVAPTHSSRTKLPQRPVPQATEQNVGLPGNFYVGAGVGLLATICPTWTTTAIFSLGSSDPVPDDNRGCYSSGFRSSVYAGYDWTLASRWLVGVETDLGYATNNRTSGVPAVSSAPGDTVNVKENFDGSARVRLGYAATAQATAYVTTGIAFQHFDATVTCAGMSPNPCGRFGPVAPMTATNSPTRTGWTLGGGVEYAFAANLKVRAEYRYADYGTYGATYGNPANVAVSSDIRLRTQTATVGLSYSFGRN
jgi:opacity protein-like surface antigen